MRSVRALLFAFVTRAFAIPGSSNSNTVCSKDPYKALLPLSAYPPAQSYCSSKYPISASTTTTTTTAPACIATGAPASAGKRAAEPNVDLSERDNDSRKKALASLIAAKQSIISTACSCIQTATTVTSTVTTTSSLAAPLPSCCNGAPFAQIRQYGSDLYGICTSCTYSTADGDDGIENYPYSVGCCDFTQYCARRCSERGAECQGVTKQLPTTGAYNNCKFLSHAVGGGSSSGDSDTEYKLPANVPLCSGTQVTTPGTMCNGGCV